MKTLLTYTNTKTRKGEKFGYLTGALHLAPANISGHNICPGSSPQCRALCLNLAGRGIFENVQKARLEKTLWFFENRASFLCQLDADLSALERKAERENLKPCARLNCLSDLDWPRIAPGLFIDHPTVQFYDYTKVQTRFSRPLPANYHLTFSLSESNKAIALPILKAKANLAVVFHDRLPVTWEGFPVINGDESDLRFLDGRAFVVGLKAKGLARNSDSAFVQN